MKPQSSGFTLIEILVAVAIFGLLSVGAYTVLDAGMRSQAQTESRLSKLETLQRAMQTIERDLQMLSQRLVRDEFGDRVPLFRGQSDISGQQSSFEFTRADWRNPAGLPRSNLQHLMYKFEQGKLQRTHSIFLDQSSNSPKISHVLLEDMHSMSLSFLNKSGQWITNWGMFNDTENNLPFPKAVKITMEVDPFGSIERIIIIGTVSDQVIAVGNGQ